MASSSPIEESPTPACGVASATARLRLGDDSPIRRVPGQSRSLARGPGPVIRRGSGMDMEMTDEEEDEGSVFLSAQKSRKAPGSPLKFGTNNLMAMTDEGDEGESPLLSPKPLLGTGPPIPQPLFPSLRQSQSQDCEAMSSSSGSGSGSSSGKSLFAKMESASRIPRLSTSHPIRVGERTMLSQKKAVSLDAIPVVEGDRDEPFGNPRLIGMGMGTGKKVRPGMGGGRDGRAHKRINSGEGISLGHHNSSGSISRSFGQKSGLALSLSPGISPVPDFSHSNSSLSSVISSVHPTPPPSGFAPAEPPIFEDVKPLAEAFITTQHTVSRKFKPRDSGVSMGNPEEEKVPLPTTRICPPSVMKVNPNRPRRPAMLKRTSSMGDERNTSTAMDCETPSIGHGMSSGWPGFAAPAFDFLGESGKGIAFGISGGEGEKKLSMPDTPVKRSAYGNGTGRVGVVHSMSQPTLGSSSSSGSGSSPSKPGEVSSSGSILSETDTNLPYMTDRERMPPPTMRKVIHQTGRKKSVDVLHLVLTSTSSPDSPTPGVGLGIGGMDLDPASPTVARHPPVARIGLLRGLEGVDSGSEEEGTPTKGGGVARLSLTTGELYSGLRVGKVEAYVASRTDYPYTYA
jgi:mitosis inhibitor protein kinase SWE1